MNYQSKCVKYLKNNKIIILLILIPIILSVFLRIQSIELAEIDKIAKNEIESFIKNELFQKILKENPNLPHTQKLKLLEKKFEEFKQLNSEEIDAQIKKSINYFKSKLRDDSGQVYLTTIDPYYYARHARNIIERGYIGDELRDGRPYNNHQIAPLGKFSEPNTHMWISAYLYKFVKAFMNPNIPFTTVFFYIPVIISALAVIPAFFIGKRLHNDLTGFFSALIIAFHPLILSRTFAGFVDTDSYSLLMSLLLVLSFFYLFEQITFKRIFIFSLITGFLFGNYSNLWSGWGYLFYILVASLILTLGYNIFNFFKTFNKQEKLNIKQSFFILFLSSIFGITGLTLVRAVFHGRIAVWAQVSSLIISPISFIFMETGLGKELLWPNIFSTIQELQIWSFANIVHRIGGYFLFILFLIGLVILLIQLYNSQKISLFFFFIIWIFSTFYGATKGVRFVFIFSILFSIILGYVFGKIVSYFSRSISINLKIHKYLSFALVLSLVTLYLFIGIPPISESLFLSSWNGVRSELPLINDAWWEILEEIKESTDEDTIVTSWWDYGHWFKFVADRPVTFDGASQNTPQSYWVSRFFTTSNEKEAIGILRMLDCGANSAFDNIFEWTNSNFLKSIEIIQKAVLLNKKQAQQYYLIYFTDKQTENLLSLTHCSPPEAVVIVSEDMVTKAHVFGRFGEWNFTRKFLSIKAKKSKYDFIELAKPLGYSSESAEELFIWISTAQKDEIQKWIAARQAFNWIYPIRCNEIDDFIVCDGKIREKQFRATIDKKDYSTQIRIANRVYIPSEIIYLDQNLHFKKFPNPSFNNPLILIKSPQGYKLQLTEGSLGESLFVKLFYFNGADLNNFKLLSKTKAYTGDEIKAFKVVWPEI